MSSEGFAQMTSPAPDDVFGVWHETLLRVRYAETDKMGIVYYANYLVWFEIGRTDYCRARGFSYRDMEQSEDAFLVVAEAYCRYKAPAYYDDELIVRTHITELRKRSLRFVRWPRHRFVRGSTAGNCRRRGTGTSIKTGPR